MNYQYKVIVRNRTVYKEFEIHPELKKVKLGTTANCEFRVDPEAFFESFELELDYQDQNWGILCTDTVYLSTGDMRKLISTEIRHGDVLSVRYASSGDEVFELRFMIDFDAKIQRFDARVRLQENVQLLLGGDSGCNLLLKSEFCRSSEVKLCFRNPGLLVQEIHFKYGLLCNGRQVKENVLVGEYSFLSIADTGFYYKDQYLYFDSEKVESSNIQAEYLEDKSNCFQYPLFNRSTRLQTVLDLEPIEILDPPDKPKKPKKNVIMALLPAIIMLAVTIVVRGFMSSTNSTFIIISVISMTMGIITSAASIITERKEYRIESRQRVEKYSAYLEKKKEEISLARQKELDVLNDTYLDLKEGIALVEKFNGRLFERLPEDKDFLYVFLGRGKVKAAREINYRKRERYDVEDELLELPEKIYRNFFYIEYAPITVNLRAANAVGIIGDPPVLYEAFKNIILDISIRQYYTDVQLFVFLDEFESKQYQWIRLLPHLHMNHEAERNIVCDNESKNNIFEFLYKELTRREEEGGSYPYLIIIVKAEIGLKSHPISRFVPNASKLNTVFIFFEKTEELLPLCCDEMIHFETAESGYVVQSKNKDAESNFEFETIDDELAEKVVRRLAPIYCEEISLESSLKKSITLFELLDIYNVNDLNLNKRWASTQVYKSMAAPLGINAKEEIVSLDLNEKMHGPHGLVAGTTGSGKSEILQSYILSMVSLFHPYEVGFVIIDFKGGGMVNQFKHLPHLVGAITNIDGKEIDRSLKSIKAELLKRQSIFAEAEVNHIDKYIKLFKEGKVKIALPHLIIIVDEFAELKAEQPEFMKELISAARIGRSLGVHLILATQKPAGQVNEQIWSNSKFKLCLKVQTKEDSNEVIKTPVAAEIREPGRAYFQVGNNELFELFQSGFSGAPAQNDDSNIKEYNIYQVGFSGKKQVIFSQRRKKSSKKVQTQLEAIVDYVWKHCEENHIEKLPDICLPSLEKRISYPTDKVIDKNIEMLLPIGIYDNPDCQYQGESNISISSENTIIIGSAQYGKTNLLQTMIRGMTETYSPKELNIYILDFGAMLLKNFEALKHVGGVVCPSDDEKFKNLFKLLNGEIKRRKELLLSAGVSSFSSYKEAGYLDLPQIVLLVDNYTAVKELYLSENDCLLPICRDGISVGISVTITNSQTSGIGYKYLSNFAGKIALYCNDSNEYSALLQRCRMVPDNTAGRGLIEIDREVYEFQTYLSFEGEREIDRVNNMREFVAEMNAKYGDDCARKIPEVPAMLEETSFLKTFGITREDSYLVPVGLDYEEIEPVAIDLVKQTVLSIIGKEKMGRGNLVKIILNQLYHNMFSMPVQVHIIDDIEYRFEEFQNMGIVSTYSIDANDYPELILELHEELKQRQSLLTEQGAAALQQMPLLLVLVQNKDAVSLLSKNTDAIKKYKEILTLYKNLKICFLYTNIENAAVSFSGSEVLKLIKENKGIFYFDDLQNMKICDITGATARKFKKEISAGDAYFLDGNKITKVKTVKQE